MRNLAPVRGSWPLVIPMSYEQSGAAGGVRITFDDIAVIVGRSDDDIEAARCLGWVILGAAGRQAPDI